MAHAVETLAYSGELPWHGLGVLVEDDLTPDEMLVKAGLDWTVEKIPLSANVGGKEIIANHAFLVRSSDQSILDEVTTDWNTVQNHEAFAFFDDFIKKGDMKMHTAGSLHNGQLVWALAKTTGAFTLFANDTVEAYFLFVNPHRFGKSIDIRFTATRVVCQNTLSMALKEGSSNSARITHRAAFDADRVKEMMNISEHQLEQYRQAAEFIGSKRYDEDSMKKYVTTLFPLTTNNENTKKEISLGAKKVMDIIPTQPGVEYGEGTFWQLFNGVTYYVDHVMGREQNNRVESAWLGAGRIIKAKALDTAIEMAKAA
jgi:phage/plasmid-like protein (TIGR03299 family)